MSLITSMRRQKGVYWARTGTDEFGNAKYAGPVQIKCRWEDSNEMFKGVGGEDEVSNARVYVDRDCPEGGVLWQGMLVNLVSQTKPFKNPGAYEIRKYGKLPTLKATEFLRTCWL